MKKLLGDEGWGGGACFSLLTPSVCAENDCSGNDGAGKLFWCIKNFSSCCFLVAIKFLAILSVNANANMLSASR